MGCAHVGSKLYFTGGRVKEYETSDKMFVLDLKKMYLGVRKAPPMKFGKLIPVPVVVNNKIYVFEGGFNFIDHAHFLKLLPRGGGVYDNLYRFTYLEAFDTVSKKWQPLPQDIDYFGGLYSGITVARDVIFLYRGVDFTIECFHINTQEWNQFLNGIDDELG